MTAFSLHTSSSVPMFLSYPLSPFPPHSLSQSSFSLCLILVLFQYQLSNLPQLPLSLFLLISVPHFSFFLCSVSSSFSSSAMFFSVPLVSSAPTFLATQHVLSFISSTSYYFPFYSSVSLGFLAFSSSLSYSATFFSVPLCTLFFYTSLPSSAGFLFPLLSFQLRSSVFLFLPLPPILPFLLLIYVPPSSTISFPTHLCSSVLFLPLLLVLLPLLHNSVPQCFFLPLLFLHFLVFYVPYFSSFLSSPSPCAPVPPSSPILSYVPQDLLPSPPLPCLLCP